MKKEEFLRRLEHALRGMPEEERRSAVDYYANYFAEAGSENEQDVLDSLGAPEKVAADILRDYKENEASHRAFSDLNRNKAREKVSEKARSMRNNYRTMDRGQRLLLVVLLIAAISIICPAAVGIVGGFSGLAVGILCVIVSVFVLVPILDLTAWVVAVACLITSGAYVSHNPTLALWMLGFGLISAAAGILLWNMTVQLFCRTFPAMLRSVVDFVRKLFNNITGRRSD